MTLGELKARFSNEDACRKHLFRLRWPDGKVACPRCGESKKVYARKTAEYRWTCKSCNKNGYGFSLTTGTVFEDTKLELRDWFQMLMLMLSSKKGMSALQIQRMVFGEHTNRQGKLLPNGSYESTWYACHRLRAAMRDPGFLRLTGHIEMDETFVGGKAKNRHGGMFPSKRKRGAGPGGKHGKVAVVGAIARKGNVVCQVIDRVSERTVGTFVDEVIGDRVSISTDQAKVYKHLDWESKDAKHESVNHLRGEFVRGAVHTANLDSFWSLLKRGIIGTYHKVSKDHLPLYLNEFAFRHNNRNNPATFDRVLESC